MITGKELEETAAKSSKKVPALLSLDGVYRTTIYDWQAIAAEISPKPLTIGELTMMLWDSACLDQCVLRHELIGTTAEGKFEIKKLLDLINNKQKEQP